MKIKNKQLNQKQKKIGKTKNSLVSNTSIRLYQKKKNEKKGRKSTQFFSYCF